MYKKDSNNNLEPNFRNGILKTTRGKWETFVLRKKEEN